MYISEKAILNLTVDIIKHMLKAHESMQTIKKIAIENVCEYEEGKLIVIYNSKDNNINDFYSQEHLTTIGDQEDGKA